MTIKQSSAERTSSWFHSRRWPQTDNVGVSERAKYRSTELNCDKKIAYVYTLLSLFMFSYSSTTANAMKHLLAQNSYRAFSVMQEQAHKISFILARSTVKELEDFACPFHTDPKDQPDWHLADASSQLRSFSQHIISVKEDAAYISSLWLHRRSVHASPVKIRSIAWIVTVLEAICDAAQRKKRSVVNIVWT